MTNDKYGTTKYKRKTYYLTQQPYWDRDYNNGTEHYTASAVDRKGRQFQMFWSLLDGYRHAEKVFQCENEDEACDWDIANRVYSYDTGKYL